VANRILKNLAPEFEGLSKQILATTTNAGNFNSTIDTATTRVSDFAWGIGELKADLEALNSIKGFDTTLTMALPPGMAAVPPVVDAFFSWLHKTRIEAEDQAGKKFPIIRLPEVDDSVAPSIKEAQKGVEDYYAAITKANNSTFFDETAKRATVAGLRMDDFNKSYAKLFDPGLPWQNTISNFDELERAIANANSQWVVGGVEGLQYYSDYAGDVASNVEDSIVGAFSNMEDSIVEFAMTGKTSFKDLANSIIADMMRIVVQESITKPLAGAVLSGMSSMFGGTAYGTTSGFTTGAGMGPALANGGVMLGGQLQAFASGGVVNSPTLFPMANGTGLMGEAGPEAIMPLTRIGGKLGVKAQGTQSKSVTIHQHFDMRDYSSEERLKAVVSQAAKEGGQRGYEAVFSDIGRRGPIRRAIN